MTDTPETAEEMKTAYLEVTLRIPIKALDREEQIRDLDVPEDEVMEAHENNPAGIAEHIASVLADEVAQEEMWAGSDYMTWIQDGTEVLSARWDLQEERSPLEKVALEVFASDYATSELEIDAVNATAGSDMGVWVRCWQFIPLSEISDEEPVLDKLDFNS